MSCPEAGNLGQNIEETTPDEDLNKLMRNMGLPQDAKFDFLHALLDLMPLEEVDELIEVEQTRVSNEGTNQV